MGPKAISPTIFPFFGSLCKLKNRAERDPVLTLKLPGTLERAMRRQMRPAKSAIQESSSFICENLSMALCWPNPMASRKLKIMSCWNHLPSQHEVLGWGGGLNWQWRWGVLWTIGQMDRQWDGRMDGRKSENNKSLYISQTHSQNKTKRTRWAKTNHQGTYLDEIYLHLMPGCLLLFSLLCCDLILFTSKGNNSPIFLQWVSQSGRFINVINFRWAPNSHCVCKQMVKAKVPM